MRKHFIILLLICSLILLLTGCQYTTKRFGGQMTLELSPGVKLEEITWKDDDLWILTRPMRENEKAETHVFYQSTNFHIMEGKVTIIEKEAE